MNRYPRRTDTGWKRLMMWATIVRCRDSGNGDPWDLWAGCAYFYGILCRFASYPYSDFVLPLPLDTLMCDVWGIILKYYIYLGHLNLAVWRCYISFLSRWYGSDVLLYGGLHTYPLVYVVDPFACRLRRPYRSRWDGSGWDGRKVYPWVAFRAPPYYFNHYRSSRLVTRSVIHRGSYILVHLYWLVGIWLFSSLLHEI